MNNTVAPQSINTEHQTTDFTQVRHAYETVEGLKIFYREAGAPEKPTILLLHGFPSSPEEYEYTFDNIALTM